MVSPMKDEQDDSAGQTGLPMGRFPEGSHTDVLDRLWQLAANPASSTRAANSLMVVARHATAAATLLGQAVARNEAAPKGIHH